MSRLAPVFGRLVSVTKSPRSENVRRVRLAGSDRTFALYVDHPCFDDMVRYPAGTSVTLSVDGRIVKDFYSESDECYKFRIYLTEWRVVKGGVRDRANIKRLYTKLVEGFPARDPRDVLRDYPYYAMSIDRANRVYDFDTADAICEYLGHSIQKKCRGHCHYKIKDICDEEGHTCLPFEVYKFRINGFPGALVKQQIDVLIRHGSLVSHNDNLFTSDTFRRECAIRDFLQYPHEVVPLEPLDLLAPDLTEHQASVIDLVSARRVAVLCGGAGSGKTRCIAAVTCLFANVVLAAPTGKAARRAVQSCREFNPAVTASTIHSLLGIGAAAEAKQAALDRIPRNALLVVDEASMLDLDVAFSVVAAARDLNLSLLFVGDPNQLPPVARGDVFANVIEWARQSGCIVELTEIHRQAAANPINRMGHHICAALPPENVLDYVDGDLLQFHETGSYEEAIQRAIALRTEFSRNEFDCQIISPWTRVVDAINSKSLGANRPLASFRPGDFVMCCSNVSESELAKFKAKHERVTFDMPRDPFAVQHIYKSRKLFDIRAGVVTTDTVQGFEQGVNGHCGILLNANVLIDDASNFVFIGDDKCHASAITVHKSQGSEWTTVILVLANARNSFSPFLNKKLLYTAATRAKKRLVIIGSPEVFKWSVDRVPSRRHTLAYARHG